MTHRISNSARRKLDILNRAENGICSLNIRWCFALAQEPAMRFLLKRKFVSLYRTASLGRKRVTMAKLTESGAAYMQTLRKQA